MDCSVAGKYAQMLFILKKWSHYFFSSSCLPQNKLSKSYQSFSIKFRGLFCGEPETEGQVNLISERKMQQQHEAGDVGGGHCGVRG